MRFNRATLETCSSASGLVIVIDVLRAFSTAAYAFSGGANRILPVRSVEEAFQLQKRFPDHYLMGEVSGKAVDGFDLSNSPFELAKIDLKGKGLIQRTSAGTQGIVLSQQADMLLTTSFVVAGATAEFIRRRAPEEVTFVLTGYSSSGYGDEDAACADFIEHILRDPRAPTEPYIDRVYRSRDGSLFTESGRKDFPPEDMAYCTAINRFDFVMKVERQDGLLVMTPSDPGT